MRKLISACALVLACAVGISIGCSSGTSSAPVTPASTSSATAQVSISDPATCQGPNGPFQHVYISVTDVTANVNADAGDNDSGFVDLTPGLSSAPKQVDLLGAANSNCFLATLGSTAELQAGSYQQIRILLAPDANASRIAGNMCGSFSNCVVLDDGSVHDLQLSSEAKTGIKIPSGQIAGGSFNVTAGQTRDLDLDFNTCESIVEEGNGTFRLKPVLHAGEVSVSASSINGTVIDKATGNALSGGTVVVALEQKDASGVDRILMATNADASGGFVFCPVPAGSYDLVAIGINGAGTAYSAAVLTGISPGETAGNLPLTASTLSGKVPLGSGSGSGEATLSGLVTTQNGGAPAGSTTADVAVSVLQSIGTGGLIVTIPQIGTAASADAGLLSTAPGSACPTGTDCASYALHAPGAEPNLGAYNAAGASFTQATTSPVPYMIDAQAFVPLSGGSQDCASPELKTGQTQQNGALAVVAGSSADVATISFTGCQ
jgi:hypothetical protein